MSELWEIPSHILEEHCRLRENFEAEHYVVWALEGAIAAHVRGEKVPEKYAGFCRAAALNLDRDLARTKGEDPDSIRLPSHIEDWSKNENHPRA
jgi:hypothetical protein